MFTLSLSLSCIFIFHSIVSLVAVIYCIVIIYLPSLIEAETNFVVSFLFISIKFYKCYHFVCPSYLPMQLSGLYHITVFGEKVNLRELYVALQGPKRCTTTKINRNITNAFQVKSTQSNIIAYIHMKRIENWLKL